MAQSDGPVILWFRRDLRLGDNAAVAAAMASGRPVIALFIHDASVETMGAAPRLRLGLSVAALARQIAGIGGRLILRRGDALPVLRAVIAETGAGGVLWSRLYDPQAVARDTAVKTALRADGLTAKSFAGHVLFDPPRVATGQGGPYRVFTPFWKAVRGRDVADALTGPARWSAPGHWPASDHLDDWGLDHAMRRGAGIVASHACVGESAARERLDRFIDERLADYAGARDDLAADGTSNLSENLAWGEISAAACWRAGRAAMERGVPGAETFLRELVWRDFAHHLAFHTPRLVDSNWRAEWDSFPWNADPAQPAVIAWTRGRTGIPLVDAGLREMHVTGRMHNRARMVVASYLTKHLLTDWRIGLGWFADCLTDWDPASNALGWQWVAGSGPDAAPYFRIFNPLTQAEKFDPKGVYRRTWIAEGQARPPQTALDYFDTVPRAWGLSAADDYPAPIISHPQGRARALEAYASRVDRAARPASVPARSV